LERGLQDKIEQARKAVSTQTSQARSAIEDLRSRALNLVRECGIALERTASEVLSQLAQMDLVGMPEEKVEAVYRDLESSISTRLASEAEVLRELCDQLQQVNWSQDDNGDRVIDIQATAEALEEELLGLREQADMDAELVQLGLAAAIVNHEYETAIRTVRSALRRLKPWADANKRMGDLYRELRIGFDHLDGYLRLLTPLQRSLFRAPVAFTGAAIEQYLRALFRGHLEREAASIEVTPAFRQMTIYGNPATFYAVFVNLVDNALFWLRPIPAPRIVRLDAQGNSFTIADTGQGVANRDREAIFEAGFTRKPGGRGLGLFIARESLRKEGYQLTLLPSGPSGGATFRIEKAVDQQTGKVE
jgi:signal transduction histidine kinase